MTLKKIFTLAAVSNALLVFLTADASEISKTRINRINAIIIRFEEAGENLNDADVRSAILREVSRLHPLEPESKPNLTSREELHKLVREKVQLKFPDSHQELDKRAKQNAEKIYRRANISDYVRVTYEQGAKSHTIEGHFFGYGSKEHSINVGGAIIAIYDLIPEDRAKFDDKFREFQKEQYIRKYIRDYYARKNDYFRELLKQKREEITKFNEKAGYILAMEKWMSPKELTDNLMDSLASRGASATAVPILKDPVIDDKPAVTLVAPPQETAQNEKTKRIAELRRRAELEQQRIRTRFAGIDADQGYGNAIWWMKHADVNLLFDQLVDKPPQGNTEIIAFEEGPVEKVELHFFKGYFHKVKVNFRIAAPRAMEILYRRIAEAYGKTDQEKEEEKKAAEAEAAANQQPETTEEKKEEDPPVEGGEAPPVEEIVMPDEMTLTWTGNETIGSLYVKLTPDKRNYAAFVLTKENPKVIEEISALLERERKAKTEAELKKLIEEYGEFRIK